ncbi:gluconate 2-dehydrogenase subunit 3 family protein [Tamlana sp. I1]|uniref:gluconate 2-dehydrogenase subunit 3 family protein n=1 Tax=Tamlana sp. I1 TaxID=2762061 RepID=UPI00188F15A7|nr:gluconate 2-dehydrogenase subunit 3 family protein [Tamlana sp. I1]
MDRRIALKNLCMGLGYTVAMPTILNMVSSCSSKPDSTWTPLFLSDEEKYMVTQLLDIILPATEIPGALAVNVPQFLDMMYAEIEEDHIKQSFKKGAMVFAEKFKTEFNTEVLNGEKKDFEKLLESYFNLPEAEEHLVLQEQKASVDTIDAKNTDRYMVYNFLLAVRYYALFGYCTSEEVGENILTYDPIPGVYRGCISVEEASKGKAWSL